MAYPGRLLAKCVSIDPDGALPTCCSASEELPLYRNKLRNIRHRNAPIQKYSYKSIPQTMRLGVLDHRLQEHTLLPASPARAQPLSAEPGYGPLRRSRPIFLFPLGQPVNQPARNPGIQFALRFVHPHKDIIAFQPPAYVECRHIRDTQPRIDGKEDKVLHVLTRPLPMPWPTRRRIAKRSVGLNKSGQAPHR